MTLYKSGVRWGAEIGKMVLWFYDCSQHESDLHSLAQALLEHETLNAKEIKDLLNPLQLVPELDMAAVGSNLHNSASWTWPVGCFELVRQYIQNLSGRIFCFSPLYCCIFLEYLGGCLWAQFLFIVYILRRLCNEIPMNICIFHCFLCYIINLILGQSKEIARGWTQAFFNRKF